MVVVAEKGKNLEYTATVDFALNFEDRSIKSVKVKTGESVFYDGNTASYKGVQGRSPSLRSAIDSMGWLVLKSTKAKKEAPAVIEAARPAPQNAGDYDGFRGGNFDTYAVKNSNVHVAHVPPTSFKKPSVIQENDRVAKTTDFALKTAKTSIKSNLDVSGDQVEVKTGFMVNSSTSVNKETKRTMTVTRRDEMGSEGTTMIQGIKPAATPGKKKNTFILDDRTPLTINEDLTSDELNNLKVASKEEPAQGEKKVMKKFNPAVTSDSAGQVVEDVIMRKKKPVVATTTEGIKITTGVSGTKEMTIGVTVSSGSDPVGSQEEGLVVGKIKSTEEVEAGAAAKAAERAAARKLASKATQAQMEVQKVASKPRPKTASKAGDENPNYLLMLPADWSKMHWTKKEIYVMSLTDIGFIKFIQTVETSAAIQKACAKRLTEL